MHPSCSQQPGLARHVLFKDAGTAIVPTQGRPSCPGYPSERKERQRRTSKNCTKNEGMYILVPRYLSNKLPKRQVATERHFVRSTATSIHRAGTTEAHEPTSRPHSKFAPLLTLNPSPFINEQPMIINQQTNQPTKPSIHPSTRHHGRPPRNELAPRASTRLPRVSVRWHFSPKTRSLTSRLASIRRLEAFTHPQGRIRFPATLYTLAQYPALNLAGCSTSSLPPVSPRQLPAQSAEFDTATPSHASIVHVPCALL